MTKSLFDPFENQQIIDRISKLTEEDKAVWGKMNAAQMLLHCEAPLKVAFGELKLKRGILGILFGNMVKKSMTNEEDFKKNMPTEKNFLVKHSPDFELSRKELIQLVKRFETGGPEGLIAEPHPFFGRLTTKEWDILQWKHLDHHLRQFGR